MPNYDFSPEMYQIAQRLVGIYDFELSGTVLDTIFFAETDGTKPKKGPFAVKVQGVTAAWLRKHLIENDERLYCASINSEVWADFSPARREWEVLSALLTVGRSGDGKTVPFDCVDHGIIVASLNPWWRMREDLPSLTDEKFPLAVKPEVEDEGSSTDLY